MARPLGRVTGRLTPDMTLDEYFTSDLAPEKIINIMMGDLQRIWIYARKGWSAPQRLPAEVREAYQTLLASTPTPGQAFDPINRTVPTTKTRITASMTAYSAISCPSSWDHNMRISWDIVLLRATIIY